MTDTEKSAGNSEEGNASPARTRANVRPPIEYSSPKAFAKSFAARWRSVWTKTFILSLLAGQVVSLCITCTSVTTTELVNRGWTLSTTQNFFTCVYLWLPSYHVAVLLNIFARYFSLFVIYTPYTIYKCKHIHSFSDSHLSDDHIDGFSGWGRLILKDGIKCTWVAANMSTFIWFLTSQISSLHFVMSRATFWRSM